jgi:hypothetical protein
MRPGPERWVVRGRAGSRLKKSLVQGKTQKAKGNLLQSVSRYHLRVLRYHFAEMRKCKVGCLGCQFVAPEVLLASRAAPEPNGATILQRLRLQL